MQYLLCVKVNKKKLIRYFWLFLFYINAILFDGIKNNKSTEFRDFGRWSPKKLKERINRNPRTGEKIHTPEKISIAYKMANEMKKKVNEKEIIN